MNGFAMGSGKLEKQIKRLGIIAAVLVVVGLPAGPSFAQSCQVFNRIQVPDTVNTRPVTTPDLLALEPLLQKAVTEVAPTVQVERVNGRLVVRLLNPALTVHIVDEKGLLSTHPASEFAPDFYEFRLTVEFRSFSEVPPDTKPMEVKENFGATFEREYNLRTTYLPIFEEWPDVPLGNWAYVAVEKLYVSGLIDSPIGGPRCGGFFRPKPTTRYEFALATMRIMLALQTAQKLKGQAELQAIIGPNGLADPIDPLQSPRLFSAVAQQPENKNLMEALKKEFAPELIRFYLPTLDIPKVTLRYESLKMRFSYGKGVNPKMVDQVKQVVADYAEQVFKDSVQPPSKGQ